ncbi:MAG: peptide-N-glycosidase F-related protein [Myxococcota bacterium]
MRWVLLLVSMATGCDQSDNETDKPEETETETLCSEDDLPAIPLNRDGQFGDGRRDLAADFTLPTDRGEWRFFEAFTGCDNYVFVTDDRVLSPIEDEPLIWRVDDIVSLTEKSPRNTHYFFIADDDDGIEAFVETTRDAVDAALGQLDDDVKAHFDAHIHVVTAGRPDLEDWVNDALVRPDEGFAIDRYQRIRELGQLADVQRYSATLNNGGYWPWQNNLSYAAHPPIYFNFERQREARLEQTDWTSYYLLVDEDLAGTGRNRFTVDLPDAETMAGYDTMLVDLTHLCDTGSQEFGNCDAWDAIQDLWLCNPDDPTDCGDLELARYITTYHREGRWLADASPMLPLLKDGGPHTMQLRGARVGHDVTLRLLFGNEGKEKIPLGIEPLWRGGSFNENYEANHPPIQVDVPADAKTVELVVIVTGHGFGSGDNCAEFCNHEHDFAIGAETFSATHPDIGDQLGCLNQIGQGTVPNQYGTWWFNRSSWCPGKEVDPWVWDVTSQVTPGQTATIEYTTNYGQVTGGSIVLSSYLVFWK